MIMWRSTSVLGTPGQVSCAKPINIRKCRRDGSKDWPRVPDGRKRTNFSALGNFGTVFLPNVIQSRLNLYLSFDVVNRGHVAQTEGPTWEIHLRFPSVRIRGREPMTLCVGPRDNNTSTLNRRESKGMCTNSNNVQTLREPGLTLQSLTHTCAAIFV